MTHFQQWSKAKQKISMVQSDIRTVKDEQKRAKAVELTVKDRSVDEVQFARKKDHMDRVINDGTIQN